MKKIINRKMYDTETATLIGEDSYSNSRDFHHWTEELYKKRNGEYFLYGEGGPASRYREAVEQNCWSGSEDIIPMTREEAMGWAESHMSAEDYIKEFGPVEE